MNNNMSAANKLLDANVYFKEIVYLPASLERVPTALREALVQEREELEEALTEAGILLDMEGYEVEDQDDPQGFVAELLNLDHNGFLVLACAVKRYELFNRHHRKWFYTEDINEDFVDKVVTWARNPKQYGAAKSS